MIFYDIQVISASLSAINLDIQGLTENVHEFVHELPRN